MSRGKPGLAHISITARPDFGLSGLKERARSQAILIALAVPAMVENFADFGAVLC